MFISAKKLIFLSLINLAIFHSQNTIFSKSIPQQQSTKAHKYKGISNQFRQSFKESGNH